MTAAADRHLLFGLLALQNGLIDQGQLVAAFQAWTRDKARSLADHLEARGDLTAPKRAVLEALAAVHVEDARRRRREEPGRRPRQPLHPRQPGRRWASPRSRPRSPGSHGPRTATPPRPTMTTTPTAPPACRSARPPATASGSACSGLMRGAGWARCSSPSMPSCTARWRSSRSSRSTPTTRSAASGSSLEAEITGGLEHPGIVPVYGLGTYGGGRPYYAMRFIKGDSLKEAIEHFHADDLPEERPRPSILELRKLLRRFLDVCNAIDYAHSRGVIHRDIKPANIILGKHGETLVVDWGLAKAVGRADPSVGEQTIAPSSSGSSETLPGSALGTPAYMSPEQACGDLDRLGPRSDVYSLGATLYCLLTGKPPFEGEDVGEILRKVQAGRLRPRPRQRRTVAGHGPGSRLPEGDGERSRRTATPSCRALADDVERWMADEPVSAWAEPWTRKLVALADAAPHRGDRRGGGRAGRGGRAVGGAGRADPGQSRPARTRTPR